MMQKALLVGVSLVLGACTLSTAPQTVNVTLIGVNDFHGNLLPTSFRVPDPADRTKTVTLSAGGIESIGTILKNARAENPNTAFIGLGDVIGASPIISNLLRDEPTIDAMNQLGMQVSVLGNHEFDNGVKELMRMQKGGCDSNAPTRACKYNNTYDGAKFTYLAANVVDEKTGQAVFPAYKILNIGGAKVAFIGAVLKDTPSVVTPSGVAGVKFTDEVAAINKYVPIVRSEGADAIIALVHQGGASKDAFDVVDCKTLTGDIVSIARGVSPEVSALMTGHTHRGYNCLVPDPNGKDRVVIQGDSYGHLLQRLDLTVNTGTHTVTALKASNVVVDAKTTAKDPAMTAIVNKAKAVTDPVATKPIATLGTEQITRTANAAGESGLGDVIADSQLAATRDPSKGGAVIAFMNPGGIRADLPVNVPNASKQVNYADAFTVQPFGNILTVITLTGQQIKDTLEQQFDNPAEGQSRILQVSEGFSYSYDTTLPKGSRVSGVTLNGAPLDMNAKYRVTVNNFLADGGDNFTALRGGTDRLGGDVDIDAFSAYLQSKTVVDGPKNRINKIR